MSAVDFVAPVEPVGSARRSAAAVGSAMLAGSGPRSAVPVALSAVPVASPVAPTVALSVPLVALPVELAVPLVDSDSP